MRRASSTSRSVVLVVVVIAVGAGLVLAALFLSGSLQSNGSGGFTSNPILEIVGSSCAHTAGGESYGLPAGGARADSCLIALTNTGASEAAVTGCTLEGTTGSVVGSPVTVPAPTTSSAPLVLECDAAAALTRGGTVSGSLQVEHGSPMSFSATVGS